MTRPDWDEVYAEFATSLARRSTCTRNRVGCVVTSADHHRVLSIGYNGNYAGGPNGCDRPEDVGACGCVHAEVNALLKLDYNDPTRKRLYTTVSPCAACAKCIVNAKIDHVIYEEEYRRPEGLNILRDAGVIVSKYGVPNEIDV